MGVSLPFPDASGGPLPGENRDTPQAPAPSVPPDPGAAG
jgi:hypothetical protein